MRITLHLRDNRFERNYDYGLLVDAGIVFIPDPIRSTETLVTISGDRYADNGRASAGMFFRLIWDVLYDGPNVFQSLAHSTIRFEDRSRSIQTLDYFNPRCDFTVDPAIGAGGLSVPDAPCNASLGNRGYLNGVRVPAGIQVHATTFK